MWWDNIEDGVKSLDISSNNAHSGRTGKGK